MAKSRSPERIDLFLQLYAGCEGRLTAYLTSLLGNYNDVQDVLQETLLALWKDFENFQQGTDFHAWARRTAYHRVLTYRKQQRRRGVPCSEEFLSAIDRAFSKKSDRFEDYLRYLNECIQKLAETDCELLRVRFQTQGSIKDAAEKLGRPTNTVYKALTRIYRVLADCVERAAGREDRP
jgi:RNA polymerase sigma-70 factor, ECF subfamily